MYESKTFIHFYSTNRINWHNYYFIIIYKYLFL